MFDFGVILSVENYNAVCDERERTSVRGRRLAELRAIEARERMAVASLAGWKEEDGRGIAVQVARACQSMLAMMRRVRPST